jgi:hypothetical protein
MIAATAPVTSFFNRLNPRECSGQTERNLHRPGQAIGGESWSSKYEVACLERVAGSVSSIA